jgi:multidrug efflux pump subunit AcrB
MNFSASAIKHPTPVILLFAMLTIAGLIGFSRMKVQDEPDIDFPVVFVNTALPGASPVQLEADVARKIEHSLATISHVRHIYTTISDGLVETTVQFRLEKDVAEAMADVRDAVGRVRSDLPVAVRDPVITRLDLAGVPALTYTVRSDQIDEGELSWLIDNTISKRLMLVPGVGRVGRLGGVEREIRVELDPVKLAALNVSAADVSQQLRRVQQETSGGQANVSGSSQTVRTVGTVRSVAELGALQLSIADGRRMRLDQVAKISDTHAERRSISLLDGKPVVGFDVTRNSGASEIEVAAAVRAAIAEVRAAQPRIVIAEAFNSVDKVSDNYQGSMNLLYEGALLAVIVVWFFLRDWRATLISAVALPLSIIPTFMVMGWFGLTLNWITLLALALVVGILVDDAIVEIENIMRHLRMGKTRVQAALDAVDEIGLAVIATSVTLVAVFLPTAFMDGVVGQYFKQFGWTAALAVTASLIVARLLTPMMAAMWLKPHAEKVEEQDGPVMQHYLKAADWCLSHRRTTVVLSGLFFLFSLILVAFLPSAFFPPENGAQTQVSIELPPGSTLEATRDSAEQARALVARDPDVVQVLSAIGGVDLNRAVLTVLLKHRDERERTQAEINIGLREQLARLPGARVLVGSADEESDELTIALEGDDPVALKAVAQAIQREARAIPGLGSIYSSASLLQPELIVTPDFARAADLGVSAEQIGETLRIATEGDYEQELAKLNLPERQVPIRVQLARATREDLEQLKRLPLAARNGTVPLSAVAELRIDSGTSRIERRDRTPRIVVHIELNGREINEIEDQVNAMRSLRELPAGVQRGKRDNELQLELFANFGMAMLTGILCVYMVLVLLFRGFMQPMTVMVALPLSIGGAFGALLFTGSSLSLPSLLGLLMLMGIAVKNSVLLVDYAMRAMRERALPRRDALMEACRLRARPIVMTSVAMAAGMFPIAMGWGADASLRAPMAIAVIGGLITSTLLSLVVIPVVFTYVDDVMQWTRRLLRRHPPTAATSLTEPMATAS